MHDLHDNISAAGKLVRQQVWSNHAIGKLYTLQNTTVCTIAYACTYNINVQSKTHTVDSQLTCTRRPYM